VNVCDGRIIQVDLSRGGAMTDLGHISDYAPFLGGRGVNQALLVDRLPTEVEGPFDPACPVAIGAGLLCGTGAPGAARLSLDSLNPFTGGIASSNVGGEVATALRTAGIANILLTGRSDRPCILTIEEGAVGVHEAEGLWGHTVPECDRLLRQSFGEDVSTLTIGLAGENRVWAASVMADGARAAGRCGLGAVWGAKRLKAIVVRGSAPMVLAHPERFRSVVARCLEKLDRSPFNRRRMTYGVYCYETPWDVESPYRNFSGEPIPQGKIHALHPDAFLPYLVARRSCGNCPIACWTTHAFTDPDGTTWRCEGLQGNDPDNFGAKLDFQNPRDVLKGHALCNALGLDVDTTSNVIAWAISCYTSGLLSAQEVDGIPLGWGDAPSIFSLIERIARREGIGDLLAAGCLRAAQRLGRGSESHCRHVRGNDLFESLWQSPAWAFGTVLSPRGGTHTRGAVIEERLRDLPAELAKRWYGLTAVPQEGSTSDVERLVIHQERFCAVLDSLGVCFFVASGRPDMILPEDVAALLSAATGWAVDEGALLRIGERVHTQERCINWLLGLPGRGGDQPPPHFVTTPLVGRYRIDDEGWQSLLDRYYARHGWSLLTGWPTAATLHGLGLEALCNRLREAGRITE